MYFVIDINNKPIEQSIHELDCYVKNTLPISTSSVYKSFCHFVIVSCNENSAQLICDYLLKHKSSFKFNPKVIEYENDNYWSILDEEKKAFTASISDSVNESVRCILYKFFNSRYSLLLNQKLVDDELINIRILFELLIHKLTMQTPIDYNDYFKTGLISDWIVTQIKKVIAMQFFIKIPSDRLVAAEFIRCMFEKTNKGSSFSLENIPTYQETPISLACLTLIYYLFSINNLLDCRKFSIGFEKSNNEKVIVAINQLKLAIKINEKCNSNNIKNQQQIDLLNLIAPSCFGFYLLLSQERLNDLISIEGLTNRIVVADSYYPPELQELALLTYPESLFLFKKREAIDENILLAKTHLLSSDFLEVKKLISAVISICSSLCKEAMLSKQEKVLNILQKMIGDAFSFIFSMPLDFQDEHFLKFINGNKTYKEYCYLYDIIISTNGPFVSVAKAELLYYYTDYMLLNDNLNHKDKFHEKLESLKQILKAATLQQRVLAEPNLTLSMAININMLEDKVANLSSKIELLNETISELQKNKIVNKNIDAVYDDSFQKNTTMLFRK